MRGWRVISILAILLALAAIDGQRAPARQWGAALALAAIDGWQIVSTRPGAHGGCRFTPTCSVYGQLAIRRYGAYRGGWLALTRVMRCNQWTTQAAEDWVR
jgi:putative component of membrane protein insertase Oxa1/YidC/SpoIIIJ protein YidD